MQDQHDQSWEWQSHLGILLVDTVCKKVINMNIDVNVLLLIQVMKKQCSWLRESCQIPHWVEVEEHNVSQHSYIWREAGSM